MFSKLIRRTHMYLALFLIPWMAMYALSTLAMLHRDFFLNRYQGTPVVWEMEKEQVYQGTFAGEPTPEQIAEKILSDLDMEGLHSVRNTDDGKKLTIFRNYPVFPRRITYSPSDGNLLIERQVFRASVFLERMHRRRGYQSEHAGEDTWAFTVDLAIFAMIFWVASGLWMWWGLKSTRRWGALAGLSGISLFLFFLFTI